MVKRRHRNKSVNWLYRKYWIADGGQKTFSVKPEKKKTTQRIYQVTKLSGIGIKRYVKVRAHANPYLKEFGAYFYKRKHDRKAKIAMTWGDVIGRITSPK